MTCKFYGVLITICAVALANRVAGVSVPLDKGRPVLLSPPRIPKLPPFAGVTLSGMDFGSNFTSQKVPQSPSKGLDIDPFTIPDFEQAIHYLDDRDVNLIKLPLSWEALQHNITKLEVYTDVVATVTSRNAAAIVSLAMSTVHFSNFTSHATVHQDGRGPLLRKVAQASFVEFWGKMAKHFQHDRRVVFHLMAVPNGGVLPKNWNETIQAAVTSIRENGAKNVIILPSFAAPNGTTFSTFRDFPRDFERMQHIKNPDGTTDGIVFDVSQTLGLEKDSQRCAGVDVSNIVQPVVKILKENKRQAILGTLAGGSDPSCTRTLVKFAKEVSVSYPSLAGFVMYGAGAFDESSPWALVKEGRPDSSHCVAEEWVDQPNFTTLQPYFPNKIGHQIGHPKKVEDSAEAQESDPKKVKGDKKLQSGGPSNPLELKSPAVPALF